jgi:uncharacterized protein
MNTLPLKALLQTMQKVPAAVAILLIRVYQNTLSPDHGPLRHLYTYGYCRHEPTCSEFTKQQIQVHGFLVGIYKGIQQLLHCTPFNKPSTSAIQKAIQK